MKKFILLLAILGFFHASFSQQTKKKAAVKSKTTATATKPKTTTSTATKTTSTQSSSASQRASSLRKSSSSDGFDKGDIQINAGIGASGWGIPVYAGAEYGVADDISVGLEGSYRSYTEFSFFTDYGFTIIGIGANGNYHFGRILKIPNEWDVYGGLGLSYYIWNYDGIGNYLGVNNSGISLGGQIGARYF